MVYYNLPDTPEYKAGLEYEIKAQNIIKKCEKVDIIEISNNSDYDFKDSNGLSYEIKNDRLSYKTKHFFITYKQQFKNKTEFQPAGITKTKSDYYMLRYGDEFYKIKTAVLKMIIHDNNYNHVQCDNNIGETIIGIRVPAVDIAEYSINFLIED